MIALFGLWAYVEAVRLFKRFPMDVFLAMFYSVLAVAVPMTALAYHIDLPNKDASISFAAIVILLIGTKSQDIFAYFSGSFFGKNPLAPSISPKKTWEGAIGGVLGSGVMTLAFASLWNVDVPLNPFVYGLVLGLGSLLGDLTESKIKRVADIKDSGQVVPGYGGVFDMVDSMILAAPFSVLFYQAVS